MGFLRDIIADARHRPSRHREMGEDFYARNSSVQDYAQTNPMNHPIGFTNSSDVQEGHGVSTGPPGTSSSKNVDALSQEPRHPVRGPEISQAVDRIELDEEPGGNTVPAVVDAAETSQTAFNLSIHKAAAKPGFDQFRLAEEGVDDLGKEEALISHPREEGSTSPYPDHKIFVKTERKSFVARTTVNKNDQDGHIRQPDALSVIRSNETAAGKLNPELTDKKKHNIVATYPCSDSGGSTSYEKAIREGAVTNENRALFKTSGSPALQAKTDLSGSNGVKHSNPSQAEQRVRGDKSGTTAFTPTEPHHTQFHFADEAALQDLAGQKHMPKGSAVYHLGTDNKAAFRRKLSDNNSDSNSASKISHDYVHKTDVDLTKATDKTADQPLFSLAKKNTVGETKSITGTHRKHANLASDNGNLMHPENQQELKAKPNRALTESAALSVKNTIDRLREFTLSKSAEAGEKHGGESTLGQHAANERILSNRHAAVTPALQPRSSRVDPPRLEIGQIDIVIQETEVKTPPDRAMDTAKPDFASRHFLRRL